ncbi:MAG: tetratricopeptide repeat protein [Anaerolineae bacterium]|nr:tetratricopeptide repeat protein [Anaerolineae bacterium]
MNEPEAQALLRRGIAAAKAGRTEQAREILLQAVEIDERNVQTWLWLSAVVNDPTDKFTCLQNVLELDPDNKHAQLGLARLKQQVNSPLQQPSSIFPETDPRRPAAGLDTPEPAEATKFAKPPPIEKHVSPAAALLEENLAAPSQPQPVPPPDATQQTSPDQGPDRPKHRQEYASMASALIQGTATARGTLAPTSQPPAPDSSLPAEQAPAQQAGDSFCPFCQQPLPAMATRCDHCRLPLILDCPACNARVDVEMTACAQCGQSMGNYRHKSVYFARLAMAYYEYKQYRKAVAIWQVVEMLKPDYPHLQLRLAEALAGAGRPKQAIATLWKVLTEDPGQEAASLTLGGILEKLGRGEEAINVYQEALAVWPNSAKLHFTLGWVLTQQKQINQGLDHIRKATHFDPEHGMAWYRLGQLYEIIGSKKQAAEVYRRAAQLLPQDKLIQKKAEQQAGVLDPELPLPLATGWFEFLRQLAGPILLCFVVALLDSGMRPWWIPGTGWLALLLGLLGAFLWTSGASLPRNPVICFLAGTQGLVSVGARTSAAIIGGVFWLLGTVIILYPIGQSVPEVPEWILKLSLF